MQLQNWFRLKFSVNTQNEYKTSQEQQSHIVKILKNQEINSIKINCLLE